MSTKPRRSTTAHRVRLGPVPTRRLAPPVRHRPNDAPAPSSILDAVCDQHGRRWIRYGTAHRSIWFAVDDLIADPRGTFGRLSKVGAQCLTSATQNALKARVEAHPDYRDALVAARPGWIEGFYVLGDGTRESPRSDQREVIVAFGPHPKFTPRGSLADWQTAVAPFVTRQPLPYFVLGLALSGPLLRFAPRGYLNPQVEIVGGREVGKSSVGVLAASVWAGNPDSDCGGGESWDMTMNSLDPMKSLHGDGFMFLDEANLAGASSKDREEFGRQAVFKVSATGGRRRFGDAAQGEHVRLAMLSTANTALADLVNGSEAERDALQSRRITIRIVPGAPHGVFAFVPDGYDSARAASEAMAAVADEYWGMASRAFIRHLVRAAERDEALLKRVIARSLDSYMRWDLTPAGSARVQKTYALAAVAAALAKQWGVLPAAWGSPLHMIQAIAQSTFSGQEQRDEPTPIALIRAYVARHRPSLIKVGDLSKPLSRDAFEATPGFIRQGERGCEILVPAAQFQATFPASQAMMRALRDAGQAQVEQGRASKLTIKTPRAICDEERVYCIALGHMFD